VARAWTGVSRFRGRCSRASQATAGIDVRVLRLAAAVVVHDDRVLIVRRSMTERFLPGAWGIPCGKLDRGERPGDGALRELKEETGLTGLLLRQAADSTFPSVWRGLPTHNVQHNFLVRPVTFDITLPEPDQRYDWVPFADVPSSPLDTYNRAVVSGALTMLEPCYVDQASASSSALSRS
jgi:8-oxo-dGTP diphosphatase